MIHICSGHELSIGLEVLFKSLLKIPESHICSFKLYARKSDIRLNLDFLKIEYHFISDHLLFFSGKTLSIDPLINNNENELPVTTIIMNKILNQIDCENDLLLTLPTSKDQLKVDGVNTAGYTYFLREKYQIENLCMFFSAPKDHVLLITDHIPLSIVTKTITKDLIISKINLTLEYHKKYFFEFDEVIIAGINPHAGENGILGEEDKVVTEAITELDKTHLNKIKFIGPLSGDTLHFHQNKNLNQLKVYMYHDQGLPAFKAKNGIIGLNITLGLPFLRISVDHGTAFDLFGKNIADESGCQYMLEQAILSHNKLNR